MKIQLLQTKKQNNTQTKKIRLKIQQNIECLKNNNYNFYIIIYKNYKRIKIWSR